MHEHDLDCEQHKGPVHKLDDGYDQYCLIVALYDVCGAPDQPQLRSETANKMEALPKPPRSDVDDQTLKVVALLRDYDGDRDGRL